MFTYQIFLPCTTYFGLQQQNWIFVPWNFSIEKEINIHQALNNKLVIKHVNE